MTMMNRSARGAVRTIGVVAMCLVCSGLVWWATAWADDQSLPTRAVGDARFDREGALVRPENYREWVHAGTPVTPNDMNGGKAAFPEFHNVYISPQAYAAYKATGEFPDGTVFVKELVSVGSKQASSGKGYFMGEFLGLEAAVKDSKRFPDEPGHWAYFSFGKQPHLAPTAKLFPAASCNGCHEATAAEDWVFTQYYPVLRSAKPDAPQ